MWTMTGVVSLASPLKDGFVLLDGVVIELSDTPGEAVLTVNLMVLLTPCGLPRELAWVATAWYWPLEREGLAPPEFQPPGALVASALETSVFEELKMWTTTAVVSLASPLKDGVVLFDGEGIESSVTLGEAVLTVNLMGLLAPCGLPRELAWVATAWYWPLEREGLAPPEFQPPGALVASALETSLLEELKMWTTTAVVSLASPLEDGGVWFDGGGVEAGR